jgi:hypothetical protein
MAHEPPPDSPEPDTTIAEEVSEKESFWEQLKRRKVIRVTGGRTGDQELLNEAFARNPETSLGIQLNNDSRIATWKDDPEILALISEPSTE